MRHEADDRPPVEGVVLTFAAATAILLMWNLALNLLALPRRLYVPLNLSLAAALVGAARATGLTWDELGLAPEGVATGLAWGGATTLAVAGVVTAALVRPGTRRWLRDRRVERLGAPGLAREALVRIPLGTVVLEETAFRGVLLAAAGAHRPTAQAVLASSVVFGLWHVGPTLVALRANRMGGGPARRALAVAGAVVATSGAGVLLCLLRLRTGGLVGPALAHWATNALAGVGAFVAWRR